MSIHYFNQSLAIVTAKRFILHLKTHDIPVFKTLLAPTLRVYLAQGMDKDRLTGSAREEFIIHQITGAGKGAPQFNTKTRTTTMGSYSRSRFRYHLPR
jgi:hypothetical protein